LKILISALEPSANLHLKSILENSQNLEVSGIFDKSLGNATFSSNDFNVMGIFSIIPKIRKAQKIISELVKMAENVDKILLIDSPAFNLPLAKKIKKRFPQKEIIYYILPKVWAWKKGRIKDIEKYIDIQISIFPFEKEYFPNSQYFGNPILDEVTEFRNEVIKNGVISFLAGSRKNEIKNLMPIFRKLAKHFDKNILVIPPHIENFDIYGDISDFEISRDTSESLLKSEFAYICSGTATLESAIIGTPFALLYKTNPIEFFIGRKLVKLKYVGLANIIFEKLGVQTEFHQEFLQNFSIQDLLNSYKNSDSLKFLENSQKIRKILNGKPNIEIAKILIK